MGCRRIAFTRGVAAGCLLGAAFLPMAVAFADDASDASIFDPLLQDFFGFERDASQPATVYSVSGEPPIFQSIHETEIFDTGSAGTIPAGSFQVDDEVITSAFGPASAELLVTSSAEGTSAPPVGSVYDVIDIGGGFENVYSDIAPTTPGGADTLSDTLVTPFGDIPLTTNLHAFLDPTNQYFLYDPTDPSTQSTDPSTVASVDDTTASSAFFNQIFQNFYGFDDDSSQPTTVTDIAAIPPLYQSVHETVSYNTSAGSFEADNNILTNTMGPGFSELAVTNSTGGAPPVGSVYEINNLGNGFENLYSDVAPTTPGGPDTLSDTLMTPLGNIPLMIDFHAFFDSTYSFFPFDPTDSLVLADDSTGFDPTQPFAFFGFSQDASQPLTVTGVSGLTGVSGGLPTSNSLFSSVHLNEFFDTNATNTLPAGSFQADSNVITNAMGLQNAEILVTSPVEGTSAPPVGSVYDVLNIGSGIENFYADIAPTTAGGQDTISDTLATPFGDIPLMIDFHSFLNPMDMFFGY
ncbi:MAG: hypothetical protein JO045_03930 [Mycobacterium sp.]|nr:hypothetical protein [Mycobacterium sp.]